MREKLAKLGVITFIGVMCYLFAQSEMCHVIIEFFRTAIEVLGEVFEHVHIE